MLTVVEVISALVLASLAPVLIQFVAANPFTIGIFRLSIASVLLLCFLGRRIFQSSFSAKDLSVLVLLGGLFAIHWLTYFFSIKLSSASLTALAFSTYGLHLTALAWLLQSQRPSRKTLSALILVIAGALLVIGEPQLGRHAYQGFALGILSAFFYACLPIVHQRFERISSPIRAFGQFFFALPIFLCFWSEISWSLSQQDWIALVVLAVFCTAVAHSLWVDITTKLKARTVSMLFYLYLPMVLFFSWLILGESVSWHKIVGAGLIIAGNLAALRFQSVTSHLFETAFWVFILT